MKNFKFPKSFPNKKEEFFLQLLLASKDDFPKLWQQWKERIVFDHLDNATSKLIPFLYLRLKESGITDDMIGRIQGAYKFTWYKNLLLMDSLRNVIALLNKENIPVILLKGIPLLTNVYKNTGARALGDADMLVDSKHMKKVVDIMFANDWKYSYNSPFSITHYAQTLTHDVIREITFINNQNVQIDMHWSLFLSKDKNKHPMSYDELSQYSIDVDLKEIKCKMPCYEDMIIHIVVHGAEQIRQRTFRWVLDAISIIRTGPIDWKFLIERIKKFDVAVEMNVAFSYLLKNYSLPVPESFIRELSGLPMGRYMIKQYYKTANRDEISFSGKLLFLWKGYWRYERKGNFFTSWFYFIDFICNNRGITRKRQLPAFIIGYIKRNYRNKYED
ncbi:MAG: hypothetical protein CVU55_00230 [Deltaproteobacteria bacterium HGW-Deltaproteobacteria-13]|jgi:hypothetical protein|nr:MAG: hypothetical protein CVU55_00230 [Deltaproteobacteria bacterium HGW-Deltaproteobacteria-13]